MDLLLFKSEDLWLNGTCMSDDSIFRGKEPLPDVMVFRRSMKQYTQKSFLVYELLSNYY